MASRAGVARLVGRPTSHACGRRQEHLVSASSKPRLVIASRRPNINDATLGVTGPQPDTSALARAAVFLAERGNSRGMVMAALALSEQPVNLSLGGIAHEATVRWLQGAAASRDVWAVLLLALSDWEDSSRRWQETYVAARKRVSEAAAIVARESEQLVSRASRPQRDLCADQRWSLQCEGSECGLAPAHSLGPGAASHAADSLHPCQPAASAGAAVLPAGSATAHHTLLPTSVLGSYDAVVGGELAWRQLQSVRSMVAEVVGLEGGLELWSLLELLQGEEARQAASRSFCLP